jgi:hypothetical protein
VAQVQVERLLRGERLVNELDAEVGPEVGGIPLVRQLAAAPPDASPLRKSSVCGLSG